MDTNLHLSTSEEPVLALDYFDEIKQEDFLDIVKRYTIGLPKLLIKIPLEWAANLNDNKAGPQTVSTAINDPETNVNDSTKNSATNLSTALLKLSSTQVAIAREINSRILVGKDDNGMIKVSATLPDPLAAAELTQITVDYLTQYIISYRTEKAQNDLNFIEQQYEKAENNYYEIQNRLATFRDRNTNIVTASGQAELERLQTEFNLRFRLYQDIASRLEQAKIKVQEETPVFNVLEPVQVPLNKSEPNRELIVGASIFLGLFIGFGIIFAKIFIHNFHKVHQITF
jgi:uncharacterized protein involved in exopolysaccharide biosynthesis